MRPIRSGESGQGANGRRRATRSVRSLADLEFQAPGDESSDGDRTTPRRHDRPAERVALRARRARSAQSGPGLRPDRLIAAHVALDARRREAVAAWRADRLETDLRASRHLGDTAAALVPVVIGRLRDVRDVDGTELESLVAACAADIDRVGRLAASVERDMSDPGVPPRRRAGLAALLFGGAWCRPVASRVLPRPACRQPRPRPCCRACSARTPSGEISRDERAVVACSRGIGGAGGRRCLFVRHRVAA